MIYNYTLDNGIRVIVDKIPGMYSVSMGILVKAGSVNENKDESGISHFIEHVNFKGTSKRTAFDISNDSDMLGAQLNAFTSREYTCYYIKSIAEHVGGAFEILTDLFVNSIYDQDELNRERGVVIEEINMYEDTPDDLCVELLNGAYFGDNGYGRSILGSKKNVNNFSKDDILNYKSKFYTTDNIVVSVAGGVDENEFLALTNKYLGGLKNSKASQKPAYNTVNREKSVAKSKDIEQAHLALAFSGVSLLSADADAYSIAVSVLGGGMSSRLFQTVREKLGLCYSVYAYGSGYIDCGNTIVYAGVNGNSVLPAYEALINEIGLLKKSGITQDEFVRSREQMKSSLVFSQESAVSQMLLYGKRLLFANEIFDFSKRLNEINLLTKDDVNRLIDEFLNVNSLSKAVVGKDVSPL